jgi:ketosteroid isomerase-like protein
MGSAANNEAQIRQLIEKWARAVRNHDVAAILAQHSNDIVMYDVPPPFESVGIDAYRKTWDVFFSWSQQVPGIFDIRKLHITAGENVAFCFATMKCAGKNENGEAEPLYFRLTIGLKKINDEWTIVHEHHSLPSS